MSLQKQRGYGILTIKINNPIFDNLKIKDSFESSWTTCSSKIEKTALVGYALVKVSDCKIKNPNIQKISINGISYTDIYWTTGRQPPLDIYDYLDDDDNVICLVYGIKRTNGQIDIDLNPLIGGRVNQEETYWDCFFRETYEETGLDLYNSKFASSKLTPYYDNLTTYFTLEI